MPTNAPITQRYYPRLSELITVDDLPEFLHFAETGLDSLLDKIHYKNLQFSKSYRGDGAFYSLDIVARNIGIDLPFGLRFVLNPDVEGDSAISSFPVSLQYQWGVLAFLRSFNLPGFSFSPQDFFDLGLQVFKISDAQVIAHTLNYFVKPVNTGTSVYQQLIDDINDLYPAAHLSIPAGQTPTVNLIATLISTNSSITVSIPGLMFILYIADAEPAVSKSRLQQFYNLIVPGGIEDYVHNLITPHVKATLTLSASIEFPLTVLQPVTAAGLPIPNTKSVFRFAEASLYADSDAGIGYNAEIAGSLIPEFNQIGNTGLIISFTNAKLDLSRNTNIPEVDAAGYAPDFVGLYVQHAGITFGRFGKDDPGHASAAITADNLLIGTGGVSGAIKLVDQGLLHRKFGDFSVKLDKFDLTFRQNAITYCDIQGELSFSKLKNSDGTDALIGIEAFIKDNGDFSITARPAGDFAKIIWPQVFELQIRSLKFGEENDLFYFEVSGLLSFIAVNEFLGDFLPKNIEITKLRIWENGHLEFVGGVLQVPKSFSLKVGPVKLEVDHLTLSPYQRIHNGVDRDYICVGFDGMLNTGRAGVNAAGNGIKYYFSVDDGPFDQFFSIDGIVIDMTIPGNVPKEKAQFILHGLLNVQQPTKNGSVAGTEYAGAVSFSMPKLHLSGSAGMRLNPAIPSFLVDIGLELPSPAPLFGGLGVYGIRGLIGQHYVPSKKAAGLGDDATWWDYYKAPDPLTGKKGVQINKFADQPGFAVGAGATIATTFDDGFVFSSKLFIMLGLPDVFLLQGQAGILRSRLNLDDEKDPPFSALIAIGDQSFTANLGVDYKIPDDGFIFSLKGELDIAFFFNNASGWYVNLGKDQPDSARIQAKILSILQGYAYLMISSQGIRAGAGAGFSFRLGAGPVSGGFEAHVNLGGQLSFRPFQVGGYIEMGGSAYLKVLFVKISLGLNVGLAVEAPNPLNIIGYLEVSVKVIFKRIRARIELRLGPHNDNMGPLLEPIGVLGLPDPATGYSPAAAVHMLTGETFTVNYVTGSGSQLPVPGSTAWKYSFEDDNQGLNPVTIPLDSYIDIEFLKPVSPGNTIGGYANQLPDGYTELLPPQKGVNPQVSHVFSLDNAEIFIWKAGGGGQWEPYNIYEAIPGIVASYQETGGIALGSLKPGYWQFTDKNKYNRIRLMSQDMFSYLGKVQNTLPDIDSLGFEQKDLFCYEHIMNRTNIDWKAGEENSGYPAGQSIFYDGLRLLFSTITATISKPAGSQANGLSLKGQRGSLLITLPQALSDVDLNFLETGHDLTIDFQSTIYLPLFFNRFNSIYVSRKKQTIASGEATALASFGDAEIQVDRILITLDGRSPSDYVGDLVIGGHFRLPEAYHNDWLNGQNRDIEQERSLMNISLYNRSLTGQEVLSEIISDGRIGNWRLDSAEDTGDLYNGWTTGSPDLLPGAWVSGVENELSLLNIYNYTSSGDAVVIPFQPGLKVENGSFTIAGTVIFDPFSTGICTLLSKISADDDEQLRKGFVLHLSQQAPANPDATYANAAAIPGYSIWLTCYNGNASWGIEVKDSYTTACGSGIVKSRQYKHIAVTVDRTAGKIRIYLDRQLKAETDIPAELGVFETQTRTTFLDSLSYLTPGLKARTDIMPPQNQFIEEVQILSNTLNQTIQPVWRPNSIFAVRITTSDTVSYPGYNAQGHQTIHTFGFKTAGPPGHFQQHNQAYRQLELDDRAGEFKLASIKLYIDYNRSYPDALGRYDLSKPVFWNSARIRLFFTESSMNAMFAAWDAYLGLNPVGAALETTLIDPYQHVLHESLEWQETETEITWDNYQTLPLSQQLIFLFNQAAAGNDCNHMAASLYKKLRQAVYVFTDLIPAKFYTAIFTSVYTTAEHGEQRFEVHRFSFQTSRFKDFEEQVRSVIIDAAATPVRYAISALNVAFTGMDIDQRLKKLIDNDPDNDPGDTLRYAVLFERIVFGGLALKNLEPVERITVIPVMNTDPGDPAHRRMLGILISGPEPLNDPKLTDEDRVGTVGLVLTKADSSSLPATDFIYFQSRDTSAVFITNTAMDIPAGSADFTFTAKVFNGETYDTSAVETGAINLATYLNS
ncbi:hypothetical protein SAMN05216464_108162 [Mucilaginibacter pineti]|uniref:Uncharacterized protein n=1 Tax=Mucilaginibacter pineti TaxID=1391627 RepID=A0A1G7EUD9_9SPHI|nr:hypothetical protein [Mucilaginibacter pineti]SDE67212.1 hypothetical protein SAMN05216464_108162 [Mucilaginibacter pineti]